MIPRILKFNMVWAIVFAFMILFSGCTSLPADNSDGILSVNDGIDNQPLNLNSVIALLNDDDIGLGMWRENYTIHNIIGRELTDDGQAQQWILSVNSHDPFYFFYDHGTITTMNWSESDKDNPIDFKKVLNPDDLFRYQKNLIAILTNNGKIPIDELELRNGVYYLRGNQPEDIWEHAFDATTGEILTKYSIFSLLT